MHLSTWLRVADLGDGEMKPEDRKELMQAAAVMKRLFFARAISPSDAAQEMARICGLTGLQIERLRQEQDEIMATIMVAWRRGAPDTITLTDGSVHQVKHEKLRDLYKRLADQHGVTTRTIKDWCRKHLR